MTYVILYRDPKCSMIGSETAATHAAATTLAKRMHREGDDTTVISITTGFVVVWHGANLATTSHARVSRLQHPRALKR